MSDLKSVLRDLGGVFIIVGFVTLIALIVPIYFGEYKGASDIDGVGPLLITASVFFGLGLPLYYFFRKAEPANFKTAMVTAALGWLCISAISSIPFNLIPFQGNLTMDPLSAFFESMSGWTGTGLTMVDNEAILPKTLQFWRSLIQWVGGVGVIVLTLSILARPGTGSFVLYKGEAREQKTHPSIVSTVRTIWWIFLLYSVIIIVALVAIGFVSGDAYAGPWESLNHGMTGLATGGFSVTDNSIADTTTVTQIGIVVAMIMGAIAFAAHFDLLKGRVRDFLKDPQLRTMLLLIALGVVALVAINYHNENLAGYHNLLRTIKEAGFQFTSAITCTGFASIYNFQNWTESAKFIMAFAMIIGGAAGSTAGGIKLFRAILLSKGVSWRIKQAISTPRRVFVHKLGGKSLSKEDAMDLINEAAIISFMWIILLSVGVIIIANLFPKETLGNVIFEVCSAQGNVGLTSGITTYGMPDASKAMLIFNMWIGRLEIIPIIVLVKSIFGIRKNL